MFPQSVIQEIKDRLSIVALIGEPVVLTKAGRNYKGLCPFHQEKTPSFNVHEDKQIFHCFGCGEGGDIFHFIMKHQGLNFREAIEYLAKRAGVELPSTDDPAAKEKAAKQEKHKKLLLRVTEIAAEFFHAQLMNPEKGLPAVNYLKSRGYSDADFYKEQLLGFGDNEWEALCTHLIERQVPLALAAEVGLIKKRAGSESYYDFFRGRLIFPIRDRQGRIVAFGGRVLPDLTEDDSAKYLNSPESPLFHKSDLLYGLPQAAAAMREKDRAICVEGYLDVLALHRAGMTETVAPLGTALTSQHIRFISRYTRNVWVTFDGDSAGRRAAKRSLPLFLETGLVPRVIILPEGEDPDSLITREGEKALEPHLKRALTLFEWLIDVTVAESGHDTAGRVNAVNELKPLFAKVHDPIERATYAKRLAEKIRTPVAAVARALTGKANPSDAVSKSLLNKGKKRVHPKGQAAAERGCLALAFQVPEGALALRSLIGPEDFSTPLYRAVAEGAWRNMNDNGQIDLHSLLGDLSEKKDATFLEDYRSEITALACENTDFAGEQYDPNMLAKDLVRGLRAQQERIAIAELREELVAAEAVGDEKRVTELQSVLQKRFSARQNI